MPTRPGRTVLLERARTWAPAGTDALEESPMDWILSPEMMMVWSLRAAEPVPSITRTCVSAITGALTLTNSRTPRASDAAVVCARSGDANMQIKQQNIAACANLVIDCVLSRIR